MRTQSETIGWNMLWIVVPLGLSACRTIVGTAVLATGVVVGTVWYAGYAVYRSGEAVVSAVGSAGSSATGAVQGKFKSVSVSRGTLKTTSEHTIAELYSAGESVFQEAGFERIYGKQDALAAEIRASTTFDEAVSLKLTLLETGVTEVVIRVGDGNLGQSEHLLDRMLATLAGDKSGGGQ